MVIFFAPYAALSVYGGLARNIVFLYGILILAPWRLSEKQNLITLGLENTSIFYDIFLKSFTIRVFL